ncbi:hypothetical protein CHS0354_035345 [Potamilus streckersoni]|uniref:Tetratricopeptide repeat protein n=1 Tax=Potamilus streckersoni TaxID=2493646 RepID=A0AAE0VND3_9BIVA|nr:hypothetical protein CHS0354_035345 [Potamilus streckersoni]
MTDFSEYRVRYPKGKYSDKTYYFIGGIHFSNETNDKAAQELSDMTKLYPSSDKINDARFLLAVTYERMKDKDRAIKLYREMAKEVANPYKTKAEARLKEISNAIRATFLHN